MTPEQVLAQLVARAKADDEFKAWLHSINPGEAGDKCAAIRYKHGVMPLVDTPAPSASAPTSDSVGTVRDQACSLEWTHSLGLTSQDIEKRINAVQEIIAKAHPKLTLLLAEMTAERNSLREQLHRTIEARTSAQNESLSASMQHDRAETRVQSLTKEIADLRALLLVPCDFTQANVEKRVREFWHRKIHTPRATHAWTTQDVVDIIIESRSWNFS